MKQNDEIENLFESTFDDFSVEPPPSLKIAIDEKIKFKRGFNKLWMFIPLSLLLITVIGFMLFNNSNTIDKTITASNTTISESTSSNGKNNTYSDTSDQSNNTSKSNLTKSKNQDNSGIQSLNNTNTHNTNVKSTTPSFGEKVNPTKITYSSNKTLNNQDKKQSKSSKNSIKKTINKKTQKQLKHETGNDSIKDQFQKSTGTIGNTKDNSNQPKNSDFQDLTSKTVGSNNPFIDSEKKNNLTSSEENNGGNTLINGTNSTTSNENKEKNNDLVSSASNDKDSSTNEIDTLNSNLILNTANTTPVDSLSGKKKNASTASWLLSARFGYPLISNTLTNEEYSLAEKNALFINAEASYLFKNNFTISSGFQYNQYRNNLTYNTSKSDSLFIGIDSVIVADTSNPQNDTIICIPMYEYIDANTFYRQLYNQTSISIPLYFGYNFKINDNWFVDVNGGIVLSYQQAKRVSSDPQIPDPIIRSFGFKTCIRPQIRYQFNDHFGISISSNFGYDFVPTLNWESVARKRIYSEFGIGFHYGF